MGLKEVLEVEVKSQIEKHSDSVVDSAVAEIEKLIKGQVDDLILEGMKPQMKVVIKAELLKLADKISDKV